MSTACAEKRIYADIKARGSIERAVFAENAKRGKGSWKRFNGDRLRALKGKGMVARGHDGGQEEDVYGNA